MATDTAIKHIIVTGGTTGIGAEAARVLAQEKGVHVTVTGRTAPLAPLPDNMTFKACDLSDRAAVRAFCDAWTEPISGLVLNAGVMAGSYTTVDGKEDGIEETFAVNHIGHALLFFGLKKHLTPDARIIAVSSALHTRSTWTTAEAAAHPTGDERGVWATYNNSKLANILFTYALAARAATTHPGWAVFCMTPGWVPAGGSRLHRSKGVLAGVVMPAFGSLVSLAASLGFIRASTSTVPRSGAALASFVTAPEHEGERGTYYSIENKVESSEKSHDLKLQDDLWEWTVKELGVEDSV